MLSLLSLTVPFVLCMIASILALINAAICSFLFLIAILSEAIGVSCLTISIWVAALNSQTKRENFNSKKGGGEP